MSTTLITGVSGSGKTYDAVNKILDNLARDRKVFSNILLSIDDPRYNYIDEIEVRFFLDEIKKCFNGFSLEVAKKNYQSSKYFSSLIVLDEVQFLGMKTYDKSVSDWLTLHRHFNQDVILVTQVIKNLAPIYQDLCHVHIDYTSPLNRLRKSHLQYTLYDGVKGSKVKMKLHKPNPKVFEVYKTGKSESGYHPLLKKFIGLLISISIIFFYLFSTASNPLSVSSVSGVETSVEDNSTTLSDVNVSSDVNASKDEDYHISCYFGYSKPKDYLFSWKEPSGMYKICIKDFS